MGFSDLSVDGQKVARLIDHTLLKVDVSEKQIRTHCEIAKEYNFFSVCIPPKFVSLCSELLKDSEVKVCTVIGFPSGASKTAVKVYEAEQAIKDGADEIDMVLSISDLKDEKFEDVTTDVSAVVKAVEGKLVKVIFETCLLNEDDIQQACLSCIEAGANFVKTSTGFSTSGATVKDVELMKSSIAENMQVKASGGIRNIEDAIKMINAGATRLGTSASVDIVTGNQNTGAY